MPQYQDWSRQMSSHCEQRKCGISRKSVDYFIQEFTVNNKYGTFINGNDNCDNNLSNIMNNQIVYNSWTFLGVWNGFVLINPRLRSSVSSQLASWSYTGFFLTRGGGFSLTIKIVMVGQLRMTVRVTTTVFDLSLFTLGIRTAILGSTLFLPRPMYRHL